MVKYGNLPEDMNPSIKLFLESTTYLTWEEKIFWEKLLFILPSRCSTRNHVPRNTGDNETVLNFAHSDL